MRTLLALLLLALASTAAADSLPTPTLQNMSVQEFQAFHDRLSADLETSKLGYVRDDSRRKIQAQQELIRGKLAGRGSLDELDAQSRLAVFNAHQEIVAILNDAQLDKVTCKKLHQMGSHRPRLECTTERERRRVAEATRTERLRTRTCGGLDCN